MVYCDCTLTWTASVITQSYQFTCNNKLTGRLLQRERHLSVRKYLCRRLVQVNLGFPLEFRVSKEKSFASRFGSHDCNRLPVWGSRDCSVQESEYRRSIGCESERERCETGMLQLFSDPCNIPTPEMLTVLLATLWITYQIVYLCPLNWIVCFEDLRTVVFFSIHNSLAFFTPGRRKCWNEENGKGCWWFSLMNYTLLLMTHRQNQ